MGAKTQVASGLPTTALDTDSSPDTPSDEKVMSQKAIIDYVAANAGGTAKSILPLCFFVSQTTVPDTVVLWASPSSIFLGSETEISFVVPFDFTARNLRLRTGDLASTSTLGNTIVTLRKNESDTALTVIVPSTANTTVSDTTHSVSFSATDRLTISAASGNGVDGGASASLASITVEVDVP